MSDRFRTIALALRPYVTSVYELLDAADAVVALDADIQVERPTIKSPDGNGTYNWSRGGWDFDHDWLVRQAMDNAIIGSELRATRKINAIKEMRRAVPGVTLKAAKEAVEDDRVNAHHVQMYADPWASPQDEPPF